MVPKLTELHRTPLPAVLRRDGSGEPEETGLGDRVRRRGPGSRVRVDRGDIW